MTNTTVRRSLDFTFNSPDVVMVLRVAEGIETGSPLTLTIEAREGFAQEIELDVGGESACFFVGIKALAEALESNGFIEYPSFSNVHVNASVERVAREDL